MEQLLDGWMDGWTAGRLRCKKQTDWTEPKPEMDEPTWRHDSNLTRNTEQWQRELSSEQICATKV